MKHIKHFGAAGTVTGSCHLVVGDNDRGLLVDFGMFQGPKEVVAFNRNIPSFNAQEVDNVILTHAHLDHCGRLPLLFKMGFTGDIYMTPATRDLTEIVLYDSAKIAASDPDVDPLYTDLEVEQVLEHAKLVDYNEEQHIGDYSFCFRDAGHLLGSAYVELKDTKTTNKLNKITFSGDLGNTPDILLKDIYEPADSHIVVLESTYGDRLHPHDDKYKILADEIKASEQAGAVLMIPAFSLERTQLLLFMIKKLKREGKVDPNVQVFLDSPMAINATRMYKKHKQLFNTDIGKEFKLGDPFDFPGLTVTRSHKQSMRIDRIPGYKVIIAGSGMMSGGRIVRHAARYLPDQRNRLLFVGYQGEETLGREIREGASEVEIDGEMVEVNLTLSEINNMSAHADQKMLLTWLKSIQGTKKVILVHGEDGGPRETLEEKIKSETDITEIHKPHIGDTISLS